MDKKAILAASVVVMFLISSAVMIIPETSAGDSDDLPSSFDQRDLGIVTPPKFQNPWGVCWAFGGIAAAETAILSMLGATWEESSLDLSERHLAYFSNNHIDETIWASQAGEGIYPFDDDPNAPYSGATRAHYSQLFSTGVGPLTEEQYPYRGNASLDTLQMFEDPQTVDQALKLYYFDGTKESIEKTIAGYSEEQREQKFSEWAYLYGIPFPEGVDASNFTASDVVGPLTDYAIKRYSYLNEYFTGDDWSIDRSERNYTIGYTMLDGSYMKDPRILDEGKLVGVDWDAAQDIKSELYQGHGLVLGVLLTAGAYNSKNGTLYECRNTGINHLVQLVGWDDDYPAENFTWNEGDIVHTPEGNGAWLCKNSWGSGTYGYEINGEMYYNDWGIKDEEGKGTGFFWVSYYDWAIHNVESLSFTDRIANEDGLIYLCYDYLPDIGESSWTDANPIRTSNVFYTYYGELNAVSIKTIGYDSDVTVRVYLDIKDTPESGKLVYEKHLTVPYKGNHVLLFDENIPVKAGHLVSVVVEERTSDGEYIFGVASAPNKEEAVSYNHKGYGVGIINEGESFLYVNGEWLDWSVAVEEYKKDQEVHEFDNFAIKVFEVTKIHEDTNHFYNGVLIAIIVLAMVSILFIFRRK